MLKKSWRDTTFTICIYSAAILVLGIFLLLLGDLLVQGAGKISLAFLLEEPSNVGRSGGIGPILVSTLLILLVGLVVSVPLGVASAIWLAEYTRQDSAASKWVRVSLDVLAGVPSIVFGLFGYAFFCVLLGMGFSILSGGLTLACMMLPLIIRTAEAGLSAVTNDWRNGGAALGISRASVLWNILLPAAAPAIAAGLILAIGRATAETAALIFTSGYVDRMPESLNDSGRALAVHIYDLSMNVTGGDPAAYASALVLIVLIVGMNMLAMSLSDRWLARRITTA
jgi:phosphate transport system permease protein